jgi:hypothetical protein
MPDAVAAVSPFSDVVNLQLDRGPAAPVPSLMSRGNSRWPEAERQLSNTRHRKADTGPARHLGHRHEDHTPGSDCACYSNEKMRFQSFFMLITVQARAFASAISAWLNVPTLVSGNPPAGP